MVRNLNDGHLRRPYLIDDQLGKGVDQREKPIVPQVPKQRQENGRYPEYPSKCRRPLMPFYSNEFLLVKKHA